jgi:non-specific serine/threonine protein kinase/serine/threonine-protein kinase
MKAHAATDRAKTAPAEPPKNLRKRLKGDLDNIVLKALRKEPARRYASVEQFAEDIRRNLSGMPVMATPDSIRYRARKFAQRHRAGVLAGGAVLAVLVTGAVLIVREARVARANERLAIKRFEDVRRLANSLMFEVHDSIQDLPGSTAARKIIVQRSLEYLDSLAKESAGDLSLQRELASAYERLGSVQGDMYGSSLGDAAGSVQSFSKALAIRRAILRPAEHNSRDIIALAQTYQQLGRVQWMSLGATQEGLQNMYQAAAIAESETRNQPSNLEFLESLARSYQYLGDIEGGSGLRGSTANLHDAIEHHRKALTVLQEIADATPSDDQKKYLVARATIAVGDDLVRTGEPAQAYGYFQQAEKTLAPVAAKGNNPIFRRGVAACHARMADALLMTNRPQEALAEYRTELGLLKPLAAADPKEIVVQENVVTVEGDIGHALVEAGQVKEGEAALFRAWSKTDTLVRTTNDTYARSLLASTETLLGEAMERAGDNSGAKHHYERALDLYSAIATADPADMEDSVNALINRNHLGSILLKSQNTALANEEYMRALSAANSLTSAYSENAGLLYAVADTYAGLGDVAAASGQSEGARNNESWQRALNWYRKSLATWQKIPHPAPLSPNGFRAGDPEQVARHAKIALQRSQQ